MGYSLNLTQYKAFQKACEAAKLTLVPVGDHNFEIRNPNLGHWENSYWGAVSMSKSQRVWATVYPDYEQVEGLVKKIVA
ncbi:MAG: hypothetical protein ABH817_00275 [archaeon]